MRNATKLKKILLEYNVDIKLENGIFELYLLEKSTGLSCFIEGNNWSNVIQKAFHILNKR